MLYLCKICGKAYSSQELADMCQHNSAGINLTDPLEIWRGTTGLNLIPVGCEGESTNISYDESVYECVHYINLKDGRSISIQNMSTTQISNLINKFTNQIDSISMELIKVD